MSATEAPAVSELAPDEERAILDTDLTTIELGALRPHPRNARGKLKPDDVAELAAAIKRYTLLQPLIVTPANAEETVFTILAGHRRHAALKVVGAETALCRVLRGAPARRFRGVDADDAVSEATVRLFVAGSQDDDTVELVERRLAGATRNAAIDDWRRQHGRRVSRCIVPLEDSHHPECNPMHDIEEAEHAAVRAAELLEQLALLSPLSRAIVLDTVAGLATAQIASRQGLSSSATRVRLWRARQRLREIVAP